MGEVYRARDARSAATSPSRSSRHSSRATPNGWRGSSGRPGCWRAESSQHRDDPRRRERRRPATPGARSWSRASDARRADSSQAAHGLPLAEALAIARQIAEALEAAHEKGVIHRDLKPANIKIRPDGVVKVLDFGLAKARRRPDGSTPDPTQSPTIAVARRHARASILGTAAYMSPEQARGQAVDKRTDIWAFGCVLFEMLTGRQAFAGETVTDTLAAILEREPPWTRCRDHAAEHSPPVAALPRKGSAGGGSATSAMRATSSRRLRARRSLDFPSCRCRRESGSGSRGCRASCWCH